MPTAGCSFSPPKGLGLRLQSTPTHAPALFRGISISFIGFDAEGLCAVAENASKATGGHVAEVSNGDGAGAAPLSGALGADAAAAGDILHVMQRKAEEAGARVLDASREGIAAAGFLVCNFAAAFMHLRRLAGPSSAGLLLGGVQEEPHQVVAALELEPLRLVTPFWLFACLRDGRVYAPETHPLFRVSAALTHTQPPLWRVHQGVQMQPSMSRSQRVLLLGFTRRLRRVRRPRSFAYGVLSSDSEEENKEGEKPEAAGHALAAHDLEMGVACVEALGGSCLSASSVLRATEEHSFGDLAAADDDAASDAAERVGVDVVVVGRLARLRDASAALLDKGTVLHETGTQQLRTITQRKKRRLGAEAELALLYKLQGLRIPCVHHQWLLDAYCFGRAPPFDAYAIPPQPAHQIEAPAAASAATQRQEVLQGVQVLVADSEVTRDPTLLQRVGELGCTDVTAIPSLLGICPWLFSSSATRELAAVLCGCSDRVQSVTAAVWRQQILPHLCRGVIKFARAIGAKLERAEAARKRSCQDFAAVVFVIKREDLAGLMDLAAVAAEAVEATASSQQIIEVAPTGRAASTRSAQRQQAPPAQQDQQKQKLRALISAAQQRVLQQLPAAMACQAQRLWEGATAVAVRPAEANAAALVAKRNVAALAETAPLAVSPEWIASCWAEARRVPADTAHGRVQAPEFWADVLASDSGGHIEDAALLAALQDCGGAVIYGDFPVVTDAKEARLRRAVGALEHALTIAWDIHQGRLLEHAP